MKYRNINKRDWLSSFFVLSLFIAIELVTAVLLFPTYWYLWTLVILAMLIFLVWVDKKVTVYQCKNCGNVFEISFKQNLTNIHGINKDGAWKYLKCPKCRKRTRAKILKRLK